MTTLLEGAIAWKEITHRAKRLGGEGNQVTLQFYFSNDQQGTSEDPLIGFTAKGMSLLYSLTEVAEKAKGMLWNDCKIERGQESATEIVIYMHLLGLHENAPAQVKKASLDLLVIARGKAIALGFSCRLLSVATLREQRIEMRGSYIGAPSPEAPIEPPAKVLARTLTQAREAQGISIRAWAKLSGVAVRTLIRLEAGEEGVAIGNVIKAASCLGFLLKLDHQAFFSAS